MKHFIFLFLGLLPSLLFAQITTKRDSSNQIVIVSTVMQPDGAVVTVESAGVDTNTVRERLFSTLLNTYAAVGRLTDELRDMSSQASDLRNIYSQFDTTTYTNKVAASYAAGIYGQYTYRQDGSLKTVDFRANASGAPIAQTGSTRGSIRLYAPTYIEVRGYFKAKSGAEIDLFLCRKADDWITVIDGKKITLKRKK